MSLIIYENKTQEVMAMCIGNSLFSARKRSGLSQEEVAEKLGVSRQTVSKWEQNETLPDIRRHTETGNQEKVSCLCVCFGILTVSVLCRCGRQQIQFTQPVPNVLYLGLC